MLLHFISSPASLITLTVDFPYLAVNFLQQFTQISHFCILTTSFLFRCATGATSHSDTTKQEADGNNAKMSNLRKLLQEIC